MSEYADALRELSEPWPSGDRVKTAIARAAHLSGLSYWRAFDVWYRKARRIEQFEQDQITEALRIKRERNAANELHDLKIRIARLEASLTAGNADRHRADVDASRRALRGVGGVGGPLAQGR
jgi:hypothetical protein